MTIPLCGAEAVLRPGGPVRVPLQPCCIAALLRAIHDQRPLCPYVRSATRPVLADVKEAA